MRGQEWRQRLEAALTERGESMRSASLKAGVGANYIHGILKENKEPTVDRMIAICKTLNVSLSYILTGAKVSRETEGILRALEESPETRDAILALLSKR